MVSLMAVVMSISMIGCGKEEDSLAQIDKMIDDLSVVAGRADARKRDFIEEKNRMEENGTPWTEAKESYKKADWNDDTMHEVMLIDTSGEISERVIDSLIDALEASRNYNLDMAVFYQKHKHLGSDEVHESNEILKNSHVNEAEEKLNKELNTVIEMQGAYEDAIKNIFNMLTW